MTRLNKLARRLSLTALIIGFAVFSFGCAGLTTMSTRYKPLHPANNTSVEFAVKANDSDGIVKAELFVFEYELYVSANGMQSARQRPGGTWGSVKVWNFPAKPTSIDEKHSIAAGFPAGSFITYIMEVTDDDGNKKNEEWTFAAGTWPWNSPIPIWGNGAPAERIDVAFIADNDSYGTARNMLGDLEGLIFDGYHTNNGVKMGKKYWQFYYSNERGHISDYDDGTFVMDIPSSVSNSAIIDHGAIIHTVVKRDWASGGNFGTEPINIGTAVHESGHAAFGLKDEYAGGGHGTSSNPHHNNYNSEATCQTYNTDNGWAAADCQNIEGSWWRPEPSALACIMLNDADAAMPDFERTCINRISWFYGELE
jgi:hypothetical protein